MPDDAIQFPAMTSEDVPAGLALCRLARWNQTERDWELFLRLSPNDCRVAVKGDQVVGTVTTVNYQNLFSQTLFSWIGMVLVDPAQRRQGIGTQLLNEAIQLLSGCPLVGLDATPAGREVYLKLGFVDECRLSRMETVVAGSFVGVENNLENNPARRINSADWPQVFELDRQVFSANRQTVLEWVVAGAPELAWVVLRDGNIAGFVLGRRGFDFAHIGPVVAESAEVAKQLVSAAMEELRGRPVIIDAAHHNAEWLKWLEAVGFKEQRPFTRMLRGGGQRPGLAEKQFAILGPEFG